MQWANEFAVGRYRIEFAGALPRTLNVKGYDGIQLAVERIGTRELKIEQLAAGDFFATNCTCQFANGLPMKFSNGY